MISVSSEVSTSKIEFAAINVKKPLQDFLHHDPHLVFAHGHPSQEEECFHVSHQVQIDSLVHQLLSKAKWFINLVGKTKYSNFLV